MPSSQTSTPRLRPERGAKSPRESEREWGPASAEKDMRRSYARVLIVWVVTLLALYAFQEYFS